MGVAFRCALVRLACCPPRRFVHLAASLGDARRMLLARALLTCLLSRQKVPSRFSDSASFIYAQLSSSQKCIAFLYAHFAELLSVALTDFVARQSNALLFAQHFAPLSKALLSLTFFRAHFEVNRTPPHEVFRALRFIPVGVLSRSASPKNRL